MAEPGSPVTGPNPRPAGPVETVIAVDPREAEEHGSRRPEAASLSTIPAGVSYCAAGRCDVGSGGYLLAE